MEADIEVKVADKEALKQQRLTKRKAHLELVEATFSRG